MFTWRVRHRVQVTLSQHMNGLGIGLDLFDVPTFEVRSLGAFERARSVRVAPKKADMSQIMGLPLSLMDPLSGRQNMIGL